MESRDYPKFLKKLKSITKMINSKVAYDEDVLELWWSYLSPYPIDLVISAFDTYAKKAKFVPKPSDIIEILNSQDGRPDVNEAWSIAIDAYDELNTVVWTQEMSLAFSSARPMLEIGDKQGAKMAFREQYAKLIETARMECVPVQWSASIGHDKARRNDALKEGVLAGKLTQESVSKFITYEPEDDGQAIAGLLTGDPESIKKASDETRSKLAEVMKEINAKKSYSEKIRDQKEAERKAEVEKLEKAKKETEEAIRAKENK